ncbi:MAG: hypothetical protein ACK5NB_00290 [Flavobacteriaceae bacterium]
MSITDSNGTLTAEAVNTVTNTIDSGALTTTVNGISSTAIALPTADGSETAVTAGTNISVTGDGTSATPYVINSTFTEVDGSIANEVNTGFSSSGNTLSITDSDGTLTAEAVNTVTNTIDSGALTTTVNGISSTAIALPTADGSETAVTAGTNISVTGDGTSATPYVINSTFTEVDGDVENELQTLSATGYTGTGGTTSNTITLSNEGVVGKGGSFTITKETIGYVFSSAYIAGSGTNLFTNNATVTRNSTGRYTVTFTNAHPNGVNYDVVFGTHESFSSRDTKDATVIEGSQTANGFEVYVSTGDNGATADVLRDANWSFQVSGTKEVITNIQMN